MIAIELESPKEVPKTRNEAWLIFKDKTLKRIIIGRTEEQIKNGEMEDEAWRVLCGLRKKYNEDEYCLGHCGIDTFLNGAIDFQSLQKELPGQDLKNAKYEHFLSIGQKLND